MLAEPSLCRGSRLSADGHAAHAAAPEWGCKGYGKSCTAHGTMDGQLLLSRWTYAPGTLANGSRLTSASCESARSVRRHCLTPFIDEPWAWPGLCHLPRMFKVALKVMSSSRSRLRKPLQDLVRTAPPLGEPTPDLKLPRLVVQAISNTLLQRLGDLRAAGVTPVIVFDGARMPAKQETHLFRAACVLCRCAAVCCRCVAVCCRSVAVLPPLTVVHAIQQATPRCVCEAAASPGER